MELGAAHIIRREQGVEHKQAIIAELRKTETTCERMKGLLGSDALRIGEGMWITPCNSIHTLFMKYDLDIIYLDRHDNICGLINRVKPWRGNFCLRAASVIELAAGQIDELGLLVSDEIRWEVKVCD